MTAPDTMCSYHPTTHAQFYCKSCQSHYCPNCVHWKKNPHFLNTINFMCPSCNIEIQPLGISHLIKPFWLKIPDFLWYPLKPAPLGMLILFGIIAGLTYQTLTFNPFVTYLCFAPVYLLCLFIVMIYCNNVFQQTSRGDINPPFMDISLDGIPWHILKQVSLLLGLLVLGDTVNRQMGASYAIAACELAQIPLPAMFLLLLVNGSLISAVNPLYVALLIKKTGAPLFSSLCFHKCASAVFLRSRHAHQPNRPNDPAVCSGYLLLTD